MAMNRREFGRRGSIALALLAVAPTSLLTGCANTQSYLTIIIGAVNSILTYIGGPLAQQVSAALTALQTAVANWKTGTITQEVIEALQALQAVLDTVPLSSLVTTLITVAIAAIEAILSASGSAVLSAKANRPARKHPVPTTTLKTHRQFAKAWNDASDLAGLPASIHVSVPVF
jgi:hypothetical protein